jgi:hypothetical protein
MLLRLSHLAAKLIKAGRPAAQSSLRNLSCAATRAVQDLPLNEVGKYEKKWGFNFNHHVSENTLKIRDWIKIKSKSSHVFSYFSTFVEGHYNFLTDKYITEGFQGGRGQGSRQQASTNWLIRKYVVPRLTHPPCSS